MDKKVTGIVAYITLIGWLVAFLAGDKEGAKFHLNQALVNLLLGVVGSVISFIPFVGWVVGTVVGIATFVFAIMGIISAAQEQEKPLPVIGTIQLLK